MLNFVNDGNPGGLRCISWPLNRSVKNLPWAKFVQSWQLTLAVYIKGTVVFQEPSLSYEAMA